MEKAATSSKLLGIYASGGLQHAAKPLCQRDSGGVL